MRFYRHHNGNGHKFGLAEVCPETILDRNSFAGDDCVIIKSQIHNSGIQGNTVITNSHILNSRIGELKSKDRTYVFDATIGHSQIVGSYVRDSVVSHCQFPKGTVITGKSTVCKELVLTEPVRIGEGVWYQIPPRSLYLKNDKEHILVTEGLNGQAFIGCVSNKMNKWIKKRDVMAKTVGWDESLTDFLKKVFESWMDTQKSYYGKFI
jgi:hypothetical protein